MKTFDSFVDRHTGLNTKEDLQQMLATIGVASVEELLQQVAAATEGIYTRSRNEDFGLQGIVQKLDEIEAEEFTERIFDEYEEQYQWFLGVAIILLAIEAVVLSRRNPMLRGVKLFEGER